MQIVFLGTGAFIETPTDRTLNTIYMSKDGKGLLLNCTKDIVSQLSKNNISISDINSIIITDSNIDGLVYVDKMLSEPMNVYVNKQLISELPKFANLTINELKVDMVTNINNFKVTNNVACMLIDDVLYVNPVTKSVTKLNSKQYSKANTLIINANPEFYDTFGFIENSLNITNKYLPNTVILNNIDSSYPTYEQSLKTINVYWDRIKVSDKVNVKLSYDSMVYDTVDMGYKPGIYLNNTIIDSILSGKKDVLSRVTCLKDLLGKELLLLSDKQTVGTIMFYRPTKCNSSELHNLSNYSRIIHDYSTADVPLLLHKFEFTKFIEPKLVVYNHKSYFQEYIPNVCVTEHLLRDINTYDKTIKFSEELLNDHRQVHMYYSMALDGTKIKHAKDDLVNLHNLISSELRSRNLKHDIINDLDKFELSDTEQMCDLVHDFTDQVLIKDVVSLLNSDSGLLQFAFKDFKESFEQSLSTSLSSQFNEDFNIELLSASDNLLKDIEIPIYDLVLLKRSPRIVKLQKSKFETFEPFVAPVSKNIKDIETLTKMLSSENLTLSTEGPIVKYIVEQQMSGYRCIIQKHNNVVTLYSDNQEDITLKFPTIVSALEKCSNQDFILDSTIVINNVKDIKLYLFDIMNYNNDISTLTWADRHKYLNKLKYNDTLKLIPSHLVRNHEELAKYINFVSNLDGSIGANIKSLNSTYLLDSCGYTLSK